MTHATTHRPHFLARWVERWRARSASMAPAALGVLRIGAALLFMQHGAQKLFGLLGGMGGGRAELFSLMGLAGVLEFFGGLLVLAGLGTRLVAPILTLEMLIAYAIAHAPRGGFPVQNGGELALLYALVFALLTVLGGGAWSVEDHFRRHNRE